MARQSNSVSSGAPAEHARSKRTVRQLREYAVLAVLTALSLYYLYRAIRYRFVVPDRFGLDLFNKQLWYVSHLAFALPVVLGAPLNGMIVALTLTAPSRIQGNRSLFPSLFILRVNPYVCARTHR